MSKVKDKGYSNRLQHDKCQLCFAHLENTEKECYPCPCSFQVCSRCFEDINSRRAVCPGCKQIYRSKNFNKRAEQANKPKQPQKPKSQPKEATIPSPKKEIEESLTLRDLFGGANLSELRIIQKNLVYLIGLSPELANEKILSQQECLGQYGKIQKIAINKSHVYNSAGLNGPCYSAYITFSHENEAAITLLTMDEFSIHDRVIRASYGTTKYCLSFLRRQECKNSTCFFLHTLMNKADTIIKDNMQGNKSFFQAQQRIAIEQIKDHAEEIIQRTKGLKIKMVFPSASTLKDKMLQYSNQKDKGDPSTLEPNLKIHAELGAKFQDIKECEEELQQKATEDYNTNEKKSELSTLDSELFKEIKLPQQSDILRQELNTDKEITTSETLDGNQIETSTNNSSATLNQGMMNTNDANLQETNCMKAETRAAKPSSDTIKLNSAKRLDSRYEFARQSPEIEESSDIDKSIQDYLDSLSTSNFSKNLLDQFKPGNTEMNSNSFFDKCGSRNYQIKFDSANPPELDDYFLDSLSFNPANSERRPGTYESNNGSFLHNRGFGHVSEDHTIDYPCYTKSNNAFYNPFFNFNESY